MLELDRGRVAAIDEMLRGRADRWRLWREAGRRALGVFNPADLLTLAYLTYASALTVIFHQHTPGWKAVLLVNGGLIAMVTGLAHCRERGPRLPSFLSHWYPVALFGIFFEEIGYLVHAIFPTWFDDALIKADYWLFGAHPTVWIEQFSGYWLNEYMQLVYTTYLVLTLGFGAYLWWRGRRASFEIFIASTCIAYYLSYVIFTLFPIEGPYHTLAHLQQVELSGGPFTALINLIEKHGRVHGGAFPSTHVAGSVVVLVSAYRFARRVGYALIPLVVSICVSTVYGRYHYAADVFAGAAMGLVGCWLGAKLRGKAKE